MSEANQARRRLLGMAALGVGSTFTRAAERFATPAQHRGPFYPRQFPLESDFDLTTIAGRDAQAFGEILTVAGQVLDIEGKPLSGVAIEIWQVNGYGRYHHEDDPSDQPIDPNFQGYGAVRSDAEGRYSFRTVKPVAYPGRAPHIHFAVSSQTGSTLVTQMYIAGAKENVGDFLLNGIRDKFQRDRLVVPLEKSGMELRGRFDIVLSKTS